MDWPIQDEQFADYMAEVIRSGNWAGYNGDYTERLKSELASLFQREIVLLCCSGTIGIELALRGLMIQPGDHVLVCGYDYPGNFRSIEMTGAIPVLIDVSKNSWSLESDELLISVEAPYPKAILVSHLHGTLANMPAICDWANAHGVLVIEDACQVPGASIGGRPAGSWGDISVLSFGGSKLMTAGRGGAVMTNSARIAQRMTIFRDRGNDAFALSEIQAALLLPQIEQLPKWHAVRQLAVTTLERSLGNTAAIQCVRVSDLGGDRAFYKLGLFVIQSSDTLSRDTVIAKLTEMGVRCGAGFQGFLARPKSRCLKPWPLDNSRKASEQTLLVHHTELTGGADSGVRLAEIFRKAIHELTSIS